MVRAKGKKQGKKNKIGNIVDAEAIKKAVTQVTIKEAKAAVQAMTGASKGSKISATGTMQANSDEATSRAGRHCLR